MTLLALTLTAVLAQAGAPETDCRRPFGPGRRARSRRRRKGSDGRRAHRPDAGPQPTAPQAAPADAPAAKQGWLGNAGLGLTFITGNTQTLTLTGSFAADRKWDAWSMAVRLSGAYGLANPDVNVAASTTATTARRASGNVRGDRNFSTFASLFVLGGSEFDHVKNIESRTAGEFGTGLTFFNQKEGDVEKLYLRLDLAARAGYETRFQYFPQASSITPNGIVILAPRVAGVFRWSFSKDVRFTEELEFIPYLLAPTAGRLLINSTTKLNARLTENVSLATGLLVNFDSSPPAGGAGSTPRVPTDIALTVGVEASF
jgi:hypothetical protein